MRRVKAFTLVELLMVIAILALLVSILMPTLVLAKAIARDAACRMQLRGFGAAIAVFTADHNDYFLGVCGADTAATGADQPWKRCWLGDHSQVGKVKENPDIGFVGSAPQNGTLFRYTGGLKMYRCPGLRTGDWMAWADPNDPPNKVTTGSNGRFDYTIFPLLSGAKMDRLPTQCTYWGLVFSSMPLLLESHYASTANYGSPGWPYGGLNDYNEPKNGGRTSKIDGSFNMWRSTGNWHPTGKGNAAYTDGSAGPYLSGAVGQGMRMQMPPDIAGGSCLYGVPYGGWGGLNKAGTWPYGY